MSSQRTKEREDYWAKEGFRYWGTADVVDGQHKGVDLVWTMDVLDKPNTPGQFFFANVKITPPDINPGTPDRKTRQLRKDGRPLSVGGNLAPAVRSQLINLKKIRGGWNPLK